MLTTIIDRVRLLLASYHYTHLANCPSQASPFSMPQDPDSESSPLIRVTSAGGQGQNSEYSPTVRSPGAMARIVEFMKGDGEPSWMKSFSWIIFGSYFNVFLVFVPLSFVAQQRNCDVLYRFGFSFFAVVPLAKVCIDHLLAGWSYWRGALMLQLLGVASNQTTVRMGNTLAGFMNITSGSVINIIIGLAALLQSECL